MRCHKPLKMAWENPGLGKSAGSVRGDLSASANLEGRTAYLDWVGWMAGEAKNRRPKDGVFRTIRPAAGRPIILDAWYLSGC